jgi:hypothetical protein
MNSLREGIYKTELTINNTLIKLKESQIERTQALYDIMQLDHMATRDKRQREWYYKSSQDTLGRLRGYYFSLPQLEDFSSQRRDEMFRNIGVGNPDAELISDIHNSGTSQNNVSNPEAINQECGFPGCYPTSATDPSYVRDNPRKNLEIF